MAHKGARTLKMLREIQSNDPVYVEFSSRKDGDGVVERKRPSGEENVSYAWSQDGSLFAWSVGSNLVSVHAVGQMLPTINNGQRRPSRSDLREQFAANINSLDADTGKVAVFDCGLQVTSLAFGCRSSDKRWHAGEVKYTRFDTKDLLVLAVGLVNGDIRIFELSTGKLMLVLKDHQDAVVAIDFAPDGSLVMCSSSKDYTVKLWDLMDDGNMFKTLIREERNKPFNYIAFSPDASRLAIVGDGKLALMFEMKTFTVEKNFKGHLNDVTACGFSEDGEHLYTSSFDTRVICWDVKTGEIVRKFEHMNPPPSSIFASGSNDHEVLGMSITGDRLATVSNDGNLRIWDILDEKTSEPFAVTKVQPEPYNLLFSMDGLLLAVGCHGGALQFFLVE